MGKKKKERLQLEKNECEILGLHVDLRRSIHSVHVHPKSVMQNTQRSTLPETKSLHLNIDGWKIHLPFGV